MTVFLERQEAHRGVGHEVAMGSPPGGPKGYGKSATPFFFFFYLLRMSVGAGGAVGPPVLSNPCLPSVSRADAMGEIGLLLLLLLLLHRQEGEKIPPPVL